MTKIRYPFLILWMLFISGCQVSTRDPSSKVLGVLPPRIYKSAIESVPQSSANYLLLRMDGGPIDGSENQILVCTPNQEICAQSCISVYRPEVERWSIFKTDYLNGGKCVAFALAYPSGYDIPKIKYWVGNYQLDAGKVTGTCMVNMANPTYEGRAFFNFVKTQLPNYYLQNFFDHAGNLSGSVRILNFNPPSMWTYHDSKVTNADITPQLTSWSCVKELEIQDALRFK